MMTVKWIDRGREPQSLPDPAYPRGIALDYSGGAEAACETRLPYPARRCGYYVVTCDTCGQRTMVTTAGRHDDPCSLKLACRPRTTN